jgi:hypothetical protein
MTVSAVPNEDFPRWATDGSAAVVEPNSGRKDIGWEADDEADEAEFNWLQNKNYEWIRHLQERSMGWEFAGSTATWKTGFTFAVSAGLASKALSEGVIWLDGRRLSFDATFLTEEGEDTHTFTASRDIYVGVNNDREISYQEVANGAGAPAPGAGFTHVLLVVTNGTNVTSVTSLIPDGYPNIYSRWRHLNILEIGDPTNRLGTGLDPQMDFYPAAAQQSIVNFRNQSGVMRFAHVHDVAGDQYALVDNTGGTRVIVDGATGRVVLNGAAAAVGQIDTSISGFGEVIVGDLSQARVGLEILADQWARIIIGKTGKTHTGSIHADTDDRFVIESPDTIHLWTARGSDGGDFDDKKPFVASWAWRTATNGNEDEIVFPSALIDANTTYLWEVRVIGNRDGSSLSFYSSHIAKVMSRGDFEDTPVGTPEEQLSTAGSGVTAIEVTVQAGSGVRVRVTANHANNINWNCFIIATPITMEL